MRRKTNLKEKLSIYVAQKPDKAILLVILLFNVLFFALAAVVISQLAPSTLQDRGFWASVFYTITMVLDAGCIQFVVQDVGSSGVLVIIVCLIIVVIGMISFTGAVIGYITNYISDFIDKSSSGARKLHTKNHTVILNWNSRASEIVNDLLYSGKPETVVVLVPADREGVLREIENRVSDSIGRENRELLKKARTMKFFERFSFLKENTLKNNLTVIVREGDIFASKQLYDISLEQAKAIIILGQDVSNSTCRFDYAERLEKFSRGNNLTVKTLIQVADITASEASADGQKIVVEIEDAWTLSLVNYIIRQKENLGKCSIVPVPVNAILGQILSQVSIMPELNAVYSNLFSYKGDFFVSRKLKPEEESMGEDAFISDYLSKSVLAVPLTIMDTKHGREGFFMVNSEDAVSRALAPVRQPISVSVNQDFRFKRKNIVILGHNSKMKSLMEGFNSFCNEWKRPGEGEILDIMIIDDKKSLEKNGYFRDYPYVTSVVEADVYDRTAIYEELLGFSRAHGEDSSVLILSDDNIPTEDTDASVLTYLIYVEEVIEQRLREEPGFRRENLDVVAEVLDPKNSDVVRSYSVSNVIISNRYISKMITQIGEQEDIFDFYSDIITYDEAGVENFESKELYIKPVRDFYTVLPPVCSAAQLIRATYLAGTPENRSILLGYIRNEKDFVFFTGDQEKLQVELCESDKLIVFSNH